MLEMKIQTGRRSYVAPSDLVRVVGFERAISELGDMVEALIAQIDMLAGDPDLEETDAEDSFAPPARALERTSGPGCEINDGQDVAWIEWHARAGRHRGQHELLALTPWGARAQEDDEDDDPAEEDDDNGETASEDDPQGWRPERQGGFGPGCPISDGDRHGDPRFPEPIATLSWGMDQTEALPIDLEADPRIMAVYRDRIRAKSYVKMASPWPGQPPMWRLAGKLPRIINTI